MPRGAREAVLKALSSVTESPNLYGAVVLNALDDSGHRVVNLEELSEILRELLQLVETHDKHRLDELNPAVVKARALLEILSD
ncbi:hypothetical protein [Brucella sp. 10RB9213]|uniref:hypothetical protein n=1 Tax=Brucella sp. 10RB9213 TaxID=1844039 RepID=UPI0012ADF7E8|nr:hypothetical protein [Brucella sp. 10RB9213]MRN66417.1 hypothetical protein [Brucella sp. 10RB9213]